MAGGESRLGGKHDGVAKRRGLGGEDTDWMPISNLNKLWGIATADAQQVIYVALV